ncbi:hypothetical protein JB92DRAFT_3107063 [Gautieria morchelliformis]|nr:hypothetical protein JB92DRAFT_3107063 [Gautieria morchelliformis]
MTKPQPKILKEIRADTRTMTNCVITARASTIRGRVKDKAVTKVVSHYNFKHGQQPRQIDHNKVLAAQLLEDDGYVYEDFEESTGIYQHPILEDIVLEQWFPKKKRADGIIYSTSFHPIPEPTIALVFTAVEYAVSQWLSGIHVKGSNFTEVGYAEVYRQHLSGLEAWRTYSERSGQALARHQQRLHDHGQCVFFHLFISEPWSYFLYLVAHAGFPNIVTNPQKPAFNAAKFARAAQALDEDEHSDSGMKERIELLLAGGETGGQAFSIIDGMHDHFPVDTVLDVTVKASNQASRPNYRQVDWKSYNIQLKARLEDKISEPTPSLPQQLQHHLHALVTAIHETTEELVPKSKPSIDEAIGKEVIHETE